MYEYDAPLAERRAAALALDRDLLRELLGSEDLRELIDESALAELELELQHPAEGRRDGRAACCGCASLRRSASRRSRTRRATGTRSASRCRRASRPCSPSPSRRPPRGSARRTPGPP